MFASIAKHAVSILVFIFCSDMEWPSLEVRVTLEEFVTSDNILSFKFFFFLKYVKTLFWKKFGF